MALDEQEYGKAAAVRFLVRLALSAVQDGDDETAAAKLETALRLLDEMVELHGRQWRKEAGDGHARD